MTISKKRISNAEIDFISLVDRAANKKSFLIAKAQDGKASFSTYGKIVKTDSENHFVTGIVYEPMAVDTQGDYMTAEEIQKAAHWYAKNGTGVDIQHDEKKLDGAVVVESWIAKADFTVDKTDVKKGTWLMTVEISDLDIWDKVEKGELTGFSMGGKGKYQEDEEEPEGLTKSEGKSFMKKLAKMFGFEVIEKGDFSDKYSKNKRDSDFQNAFWTLQSLLWRYNPSVGEYEYESDMKKVKECLSEFSKAVEKLLENGEAPVVKAGKKLSAKNISSLKSVYESIGKLLEDAGETEVTMTKAEFKELIKSEIRKAEGKDTDSASGLDDETKQYIRDTIKEMLEQAKNKDDDSESEPITKEEVAVMLREALDPVYKSRGIATNLNNEPEPVKKDDDLFAGMFV